VKALSSLLTSCAYADTSDACESNTVIAKITAKSLLFLNKHFVFLFLST